MAEYEGTSPPAEWADESSSASEGPLSTNLLPPLGVATSVP